MRYITFILLTLTCVSCKANFACDCGVVPENNNTEKNV